MKIIVMSDSHGAASRLMRIGRIHGDADAFLFLGDGWRDFDDFKNEFQSKYCAAVKGNCDLGCTEDSIRTLYLGEKKILMSHGHLFGVKSGIGGMRAKALSNGCDIMLYGHTHEAFTDYADGLYVMNPGSVKNGNYGIIEIISGGILTSIAECD